QCRRLGIRTVGPYDGPAIEVAIDGADEAAPDFSLIKGGGGALFREKAVALAARSFVVIVTESKLSATLGGFPLPVEVVQFTTPYVRREIEKICPKVTLRAKGGAPFVTDNGNHILDCAFDEIAQPAELQAGLRAIHGVVDTGLFVGIASRILVGGLEGVRELERIAR
ncbi:MAG: ribose 5-phosphate isomerase A, partial [Candidatus Eremiobacteraeota bacterium]|nr:ribose 5-phosphate isomerase A [Candidatus Eremiobacteraeota bacterium]